MEYTAIAFVTTCSEQCSRCIGMWKILPARLSASLLSRSWITPHGYTSKKTVSLRRMPRSTSDLTELAKRPETRAVNAQLVR